MERVRPWFPDCCALGPCPHFQAPHSDPWMSLPSPTAPVSCPLKGLPSRLPAPRILPKMALLHSFPLPSPVREHPAVAVNLAKLKLFRHYYIMVRALFSLKQVFGGVLSLRGGVYTTSRWGAHSSPSACHSEPTSGLCPTPCPAGHLLRVLHAGHRHPAAGGRAVPVAVAVPGEDQDPRWGGQVGRQWLWVGGYA